ncbi:MAG: AAA family ATPase [Alphaproteobacteria bacterium]|nr:AAA family ATPase [Alphaproteobacteria bacterium]
MARAGDAHVIVVGNEKGGSGKTTATMHLTVALTRLGKSVAAIDLDIRQRSYSRYLENRAAFAKRTGAALMMPAVMEFTRSTLTSLDEAGVQNIAHLDEILNAARPAHDFIIIDTPGADTPVSRHAHANADTILTPLNDSFVDFDLLARIDPESFEIAGPSLYSDFVWDCRKKRLLARKPALEWIVMRNRVASTRARNKQRVETALDLLAKRIGFRVAPGFAERVIFRELFPLGLTMLDLPQPGLEISFSMSHVAARQEVRELVGSLKLPGIDARGAVI